MKDNLTFGIDLNQFNISGEQSWRICVRKLAINYLSRRGFSLSFKSIVWTMDVRRIQKYNLKDGC